MLSKWGWKYWLKGSYDVTKNNIVLWFGVMQCLRSSRLKKHYFPHTVHYYRYSLPHNSETCRFFTKIIVLKSEVCSDWPAIQCVVIGWISQACDKCYTPYHIWKHIIFTTLWRWQQQYYSENKSYEFFLCVYVWAVLSKSSHTVT